MSVFTLITTPLQDAALAAVVAARNAEIDAANDLAVQQTPPNQTPPAPTPHITVQDYLLARVGDVLNNYASQHENDILALAISKFPNLPQNKRTGVLNGLNVGYLSTLPVDKQVEVLRQIGITSFRTLSPEIQNTVIETLFS